MYINYWRAVSSQSLSLHVQIDNISYHPWIILLDTHMAPEKMIHESLTGAGGGGGLREALGGEDEGLEQQPLFVLAGHGSVATRAQITLQKPLDRLVLTTSIGRR